MDDDLFLQDQGDEYRRLLAYAKSYLPFLKEVIGGDNLGIQEEHLGKLQSLYEMVDTKRLTLDKLRNCQKVLDSLYAKYHKGLTKEQLKNIDDSKKLLQLNEGDNITKSSEMASTSNNNDQKLNNKSNISGKIPESRDMKDNTTNKQLDNQEQHNEPLENFLDNMKYGEFSGSNYSNNDDHMLLQDDLPEFSDSRLRLNRVIGFATNASIEKLNASDKNVSELAKEIFDEITKQNTNQAICQNLLKGINMDDIDVNHVKKVIESIHGTKNIEPIQHPPLPPTNLLDLGLTRVTLISPVEANVENDLSNMPEQPLNSTLISSKLPSIREKLNSDINVLHKIGASSNKPESKSKPFISALKPGTLIDLENSKVARSSLHMESLRPSVKLNEKSTDIKLSGAKSSIKLNEKITDSKFVPDISVRDPRIRNKYSKNPENINSIPLPIQTNAQQLMCAPVIPTVQSSNSSISPHFSANMSLSKSTLFESKALEMTPSLTPINSYIDNSSQQDMSVYNEPANFRSPHINMQPFHKQFSTEYNGNSNQHQFSSCRSLIQSQNKHRNDFIVDNDFRHYASNSNQMHVNPISQNEIIRNREPVSFKSHNEARRDPRSMNCDKKKYEPRSYKEFREAKYGRDKNSYRGSSYNIKMNQNHERDRYHTSTRDDEKWKNINKTDSKNSNPYKNLGVINDSAGIKSYKIPKIKRNDEIIDNNISSKEIKTVKDKSTEIIKDNNIKQDFIIETTKDNSLDKDITSEIIKITDIRFNSNKTEEDSKTQNPITSNLSSTKNEVNVTIGSHTCNELKKDISKPKKPKKYSKEKEFEKIVKEAVESLNDDISGPRTRTRSSLKKKEKELNLDDSGGQIDSEKKITFGECSKNVNTIFHLDKKDSNRSIETGHNVISSTSKEISEVDCLTETMSESHHENIVSSNEINSTADTPSNSKINEKVLNTLLANPKLISLLQDEAKLEKLHKLLDNPPDVENMNENKSKNQNISYEDIEIFNKQNKSKQTKKMKKKEKKKRKKQLKLKIDNKASSVEISQNIEQVNVILNNDIFGQEENMGATEEDKNVSSVDNFDDLSTNQVKSKSNKRNKYKQQYEIRKDENFKIVISKFNKNGKTIENSSLSNNVSGTNKRKMVANDETLQNIKPKKPYIVGPLSVKLAKLKMEQDSSQKCDKNSQLRLEVNSEKKTKYGCESNQIIENSNSDIKNILKHEPPFVVLKSIEDNFTANVTSSTISAVPSEATNFQDNPTISEQTSNKITFSHTNVSDNRSEVKKHRPKMTELDKLHADINENCATVLSVPSVRQCRTNKQVDYVNSNNVIFHKKNKTSNIEQLNLDDELTSDVENPKAAKKNSRKLKKNKQNVKNSDTKKMLPPKTAKNVEINKKLKVSQPCKLNKLKSSKKTKKQSMTLTSVESCKEFNLSNETNHEINSELTPKVLTKHEFKDKLYFQSAVDSMECKFCYYNGKGINIVRHYVEQHHNEEVLPSRLSKTCAEMLINESYNENYALIISDEFEDSKSSYVSVNGQFTCVFCKTIFFNIIEFFDHITCHTGEYRYKCKMCERIYSNENELKAHILEHSSYDKTNGISFLLFPNPIQNKLFGYLCAFCYYIQLDYKNMVKHMRLRHLDEDKKCNGHWTIIRVNMSIEDKNCIDSAIDYNNLAGCLPPVQYEESTHQTISKDKNPDYQMQEISISESIVHSKNKLKFTSVPIKKELYEQEILEDLSDLNMLQPSLKQSNSLGILESNMLQVSPKQINSPCKSESNMLQLSPKQTNPPCKSESNMLQLSLKQTNPPYKSELIVHQLPSKDISSSDMSESIFLLSPKQTNAPCKSESIMYQLSPKHINHSCGPESNLLQLSPKQTNSPCKSESIMYQLSPKHINHPCVLESNLLQLSPKQTNPPCKSESLMYQLSPKHINHPCVLESNSLQLSPTQTNPPCKSESIMHHLSPKQSSYMSESNILQLSSNQSNPCMTESEILELLSKQESLQANVSNLKESSVSTMCQETIEKSKLKPLLSLRVRTLPGDKLSIPKFPISITNNDSSASKAPIDTHFNEIKDLNVIEEISENNMVESVEQSNHNSVLNNPNKPSDNQTNINEASIIEGLPKVVGVKSLKKSNLEVNTLKIVNDGPSLWIKVRTLNETVNSESIVNLEPGLQTVNRGELKEDGVYTLIEANYVKDSLKKARDFPMSVIKSRHALREMLSVPKLLGLYKCFERSCTQIFNSKDLFVLHMKLHFSNTEKKKKNQIYNIEQFKKCAYCFKSFDDEVSLANHIEDNYTFCKYCCPYCFYRAYVPSHVLVHQSLIHKKSKLFVLKLGFAKEDCKTQKEMMKVVNFKKYVPTYLCDIGGCEFKCYLENDFISHLNEVHHNCDKYCCYICAENNGEEYFALQPKILINHFKLHNINLYQCIFCLFGTEIIDSMIKHLAMEHFEYESLCLERSRILPQNIYNGEEISNLKIIRLQKVPDDSLIETVNLTSEASSFHEIMPKKTIKRRSGCTDVLPTAIKSARIDEQTQSSDTIVITVPDKAQMTNSTSLTPSSNMDSEFIILDDDDDVNQKHEQPMCKINNVWSLAENNENNIIIIDDDDNDNDHNNMLDNDESIRVDNVPTKRKHSVEESVKPKRLALPMVALDKLFACKKCDKVYSNGNDYHIHLNQCPFWNSDGQKCVFCPKIFKTTLNMTEHVRLHGPDRFKCSLCKVNVPSSRAITHHMKMNHSIVNLNISPVNSGFTNLDKDEFIVYEGNILEQKINKVETCVKKKRSNNFGNKKGSSKPKDDKTKSLYFSPDTIDNIPKVHIFSEPISCSLCSYQTKVRSNLIIHLHGHEKGQDNTTKEIVNPVPSMGKSELMFDKMINLSASSFEAMNTEKMRIDELNKKIVEVAPRDEFNVSQFPPFIPKNIRYKCSVTSCTYIGMTQDMLKKHISILHPDYQYYICPHCAPVSVLPKTIDLNEIDFHLMHHGENLYSCQYCNHIDFNRTEMRTHMRNTHLLEITTTNQSNIIVIRKSMLEDDCIDRTKYAQSSMAQWVCNICSLSTKYTESEVKSHIFMAHKVTNKFKCPMCSFEHITDNSKVFEEHYKLKHPSVAVKCLKVYDKIDNVNKQQKPSKQLPGATYILEQQALESIEPTIVPPTCRGIPIDSIPTVKTSTKSRGVSKSPKAAAKNSPTQARKQLISTDSFSKDDTLGSISSNGLFTCPRCNIFKTMNVDHFREHLFKDVNYKTWKCMKCFEISDSPKKMAWHVKKHGNGSKYEKIEDDEKLKWVERVLAYQSSLLNEFQKQNKERYGSDGIEQKTDSSDKKIVDSPIKKKKNIGNNKKVSDSKINHVFHDDVINLVDDSDDE